MFSANLIFKILADTVHSTRSIFSWGSKPSSARIGYKILQGLFTYSQALPQQTAWYYGNIPIFNMVNIPPLSLGFPGEINHDESQHLLSLQWGDFLTVRVCLKL